MILIRYRQYQIDTPEFIVQTSGSQPVTYKLQTYERILYSITFNRTN